MNLQRAFSLAELLISLGIIAALSSAVYPSYQSYLQTSYRHHAALQLMQAASEMEHYYFKAHSYEGVQLSDLQLSNDQHYQYSVHVIDAYQYTLEAIPLRSNAPCGVLSLNQLGEKKSDGRMDPECWG